MRFFFDWMSLIFIGCVLMISSIVIFYSSEYIRADLNKDRFLFLVLLFIGSIMFLIVSPNIFRILLGWDGLGLVSYCLVAYFQTYKSYGARILTIMINRIGDVAILISIAFLINSNGWHYIYMTGCCGYGWVVGILVVLAAFTKRAQIPFSSWLPAAIAAPTPVSALVHSSTLVTAGVYLLVRFNFIIVSIDCSLLVLISSITMFISGLGATLEYDLKKIIALSTLRQLGLIILVLFLGSPQVAYYHLLNHAFFKSLLFLCAGLVIHCIGDVQDVRCLRSIISSLPVTCVCFIIATLSLCGLPFLTGFYSKHLIHDWLLFGNFSLLVLCLFYISLGLTLLYSLRLVYYCFSGVSGSRACSLYCESNIITCPMVFLSGLSILGGSVLNWLFVPFTIFTLSAFKLSSLIVLLLGLIVAWLSSCVNYSWVASLFLLKFYVGSIWFMPFIRTSLFYKPVFTCSSMLDKYLDMG